MEGRKLAIRAATIAAAAIMGTAGHAAADTLLGAIAQAYQVNPQLNSQRAIVRQTDEGVPQALSDAILSCLRKDPGERPRAGELAMMLQPLVAELPSKLVLGRRGPSRLG